MVLHDKHICNIMSSSGSKTRFMFGLLLLGSMLNDVDAVAAGRRRRRSTYNIRPCGAGQRAIWTPSKKKVSSCVSCEEGKYRSDTSHSIEQCNVCEGGRYSSFDFSYCIGDICKAGSVGVSGVGGCKMCAAGEYSDMAGMFDCKVCESGRYSTASGSTDCTGTMCPAGKWGTRGASSEKDSRACYTCHAGQFSLAGYAICITCPKGKYSMEDAGYCIEHEKCSQNSDPDVEPSAESAKVSCARCIHSSDIFYAGFIFALCVAGLNISLFLCDRTKYCNAMFFVISPAAWALSMNMCRSKPGDVAAIVSFAMNLICLLPIWRAIKQKYIQVCRDRMLERERKKNFMNAQQLPITNGSVNASCAV